MPLVMYYAALILGVFIHDEKKKDVLTHKMMDPRTGVVTEFDKKGENEDSVKA